MGPIQHVFVLMLENRSFDHMLGFSGIAGTDAATGQPTRINGLTGNESNTFNGQSYPVTEGADFRMPVDPSHEFPDVLLQLCGPHATYAKGGQYPPIDNSGFVASYAATGGSGAPGEVMKCYGPAQLPVLNALAGEFVVCDNWQSPMPGPTWPNRMFVHAASSGGLDHSPTVPEIAEWESIDGFSFPNGDIFDRLKSNGVTRCLYGGDDFPMVAALKGISLSDIRQYSLFQSDLAQNTYPYTYVFIEPSYDTLHDYKSGTSQHPLGDVTAGEALIKETYEAIRNSAFWNNSVLIVVWDEHGGFFDHAMPGAAVAPGDTTPDAKFNNNGFTFQQSGGRVPAVVISPLIPRNLIDHRVYDHSSIPKFLESLFGTNSLTERDANAADLSALITLTTARTDAPPTLPAPAVSVQPLPSFRAASPAVSTTTVTRPSDTVNKGNLPAVVHSAMQQDLAMSPDQRAAIVSRVKTIHTRADAAQYMAEVQRKVRSMGVSSAGR
jgi:phospholipase C